MKGLEKTKNAIEEKIKRYENKLMALSKRYEWTLSADEVRSGRRLQSGIKKLSKQLDQICECLNNDHRVSDDLTMTTVGSCDTLSTLASGTGTDVDASDPSDICSRGYTPMLPLIPPTPTKVEEMEELESFHILSSSKDKEATWSPPHTANNSDVNDHGNFIESNYHRVKHKQNRCSTEYSSNQKEDTITDSCNKNPHTASPADNANRPGTIKHEADGHFDLPKSLLHGMTIVIIVGVCAKWYASSR